MLTAIKVLHIVLAAAWFGHKLLIPRDVRRSLQDTAEADGLVARMASAERLGVGSGLGTVVSGATLVFMTTGWADTPGRVWLGLAAALAMITIGGTLARPAWEATKTAIAGGSLDDASSHAGSFIRVLSVESLLWVLALGAMVV